MIQNRNFLMGLGVGFIVSALLFAASDMLKSLQQPSPASVQKGQETGNPAGIVTVERKPQ
ncbi:hypothetical protein EFBL_2179 [Effusibacillus lacus]|uniref:Uncharacterized protein n=1 Tax=Effusibacillus lacus TaxID=1348429 RepID=A0A292YDT6_9BACL|nr:hypothetical protein EDD64_11928 [Effusibacillus lacus]GAX90552.1 hypothetical protein EFBL_2179 [Effusibacillus lacus]